MGCRFSRGAYATDERNRTTIDPIADRADGSSAPTWDIEVGRSEHEARGVLSAWRKSGQPLERFAKERGLVPQRIRCWKAKLEGKTTALVRSESSLALLPVQVTESAQSKRGEPVAVYLRNGRS